METSRLKPVCDIGLILHSQAGFRCDRKRFGLLQFFWRIGAACHPREDSRAEQAHTLMCGLWEELSTRRSCLYSVTSFNSTLCPSPMTSGHLLCPLSWLWLDCGSSSTPVCTFLHLLWHSGTIRRYHDIQGVGDAVYRAISHLEKNIFLLLIDFMDLNHPEVQRNEQSHTESVDIFLYFCAEFNFFFKSADLCGMIF